MTKDLELAKKLAVLGWIHRNGFISDEKGKQKGDCQVDR